MSAQVSASERNPAPLVKQPIPLACSLLCLDQKGAVGLALQQRQQSLQCRLDVTSEPDFHRIPQPETIGLEINLHTARLTGLRIVLLPWHGRTEDQHCIAGLHGR